MFKPLITGATGLLGQHFSIQLSQKRIPHYTLGRSEFLSDDSNEFVTNIVHDADHDIEIHTFPNDVTHVYHLAQSREFRNFPQKSKSVFDVNVRFAHRLLETARKRGVSKFVFASTGGVYAPSVSVLTENSRILSPGEADFYAASKIATEYLTAAYKDCMDIITLRPFFIYGNGQDRRMLLPRLIENIKHNKPIMLNGTDGLKFNPIHAIDAANALYESRKLVKTVVINLCGPEVISLRDVIEAIALRLNKDLVIDIKPEDINKMVSSSAKMNEILVVPKLKVRDYINEI